MFECYKVDFIAIYCIFIGALIEHGVYLGYFSNCCIGTAKTVYLLANQFGDQQSKQVVVGAIFISTMFVVGTLFVIFLLLDRVWPAAFMR